MKELVSFISKLFSLVYQGLVIVFKILKTFILKTWKILLAILVFIISIITLKKFKGGKVEKMD